MLIFKLCRQDETVVRVFFLIFCLILSLSHTQITFASDGKVKITVFRAGNEIHPKISFPVRKEFPLAGIAPVSLRLEKGQLIKISNHHSEKAFDFYYKVTGSPEKLKIELRNQRYFINDSLYGVRTKPVIKQLKKRSKEQPLKFIKVMSSDKKEREFYSYIYDQHGKSLEFLDLSDGPFVRKNINGIKSLESLIGLNGRRAGIISAHETKRLAQIKSLELLQLGNQRMKERYNLSDRGVEPLSKLDNLVYLDLRGTFVSDKGIEFLQSNEKLRYMNLRGTQITGKGLNQLFKNKSKLFLDLHQTQLKGAHLKNLKENSSVWGILFPGYREPDPGDLTGICNC